MEGRCFFILPLRVTGRNEAIPLLCLEIASGYRLRNDASLSPVIVSNTKQSLFAKIVRIHFIHADLITNQGVTPMPIPAVGIFVILKDLTPCPTPFKRFDPLSNPLSNSLVLLLVLPSSLTPTPVLPPCREEMPNAFLRNADFNNFSWSLIFPSYIFVQVKLYLKSSFIKFDKIPSVYFCLR